MDYQSKSDLVLRRTAFYGNTLFNLQQLIKDIKDRNADKWLTDKDEYTMHKILDLLSFAEIDTTKRYQEVLNERVDDLCKSLEHEHECA